MGGRAGDSERATGRGRREGRTFNSAFLSRAVPGGEGPKGSDKASKEADRRRGRERAAWLSSTGPPTPSWQDLFFERDKLGGGAAS